MNRSFLRLAILTVLALLFASVIQSQDSPNSGLQGLLSDQLVNDIDGDGQVDPGDTVRYTLTAINCGTETAENTVFNANPDPNTTFQTGSVQQSAPVNAADCPPVAQNAGNETSSPPSPPPVGPNPSVVTTSPADTTNEVALNSDIVITFSEPVTVSGAWFQLVCTISGTLTLADVAVTGGGATYTINPNADFATGENCTVTVFASQVQDAESNPPTADFTFSFTAETPPTITATTPTNGGTGTTTDNIVFTFDEPVDVVPASFTLECPTGTAIPFTLSGSGTNSITLDPTPTLPAGTVCTVVAVAANITDTDTNDPPDLLDGDNDGTPGDNFTFTYTTTTDAAPIVSAVVPANGATTIATNSAISLTFSEPVDVVDTPSAAFGLQCPVGTPIGFSVSPALPVTNTTAFTLTPSTVLPAGTVCTVTVEADNVRDTDLNEPPDNMAADFTSTFTTESDAAPSVASIVPADAAVSVTTNTTIALTFSEPVDVVDTPSAAFSLQCPVGTPIGFTVSPALPVTNTTAFTLTPSTLLPAATVCTVTVEADNVRDTDTNEPPDNPTADFVATFTTEAAPTVTATNPTDAATGISTGSNIVITFSEPVDAEVADFTLSCGGTPFTFALSGAGTDTITLNPDSNPPTNTVCNVGVLTTLNDSDLIDPPDTMVAAYNFSFTTLVDAAPSVTTTTPANGATGVATGSNIVINFSEPVDVVNTPSAAFALTCGGVPVAFSVTPALPATNQTSFTLDPAANLPATISCEVTVEADNVRDTDLDELPDNMAADYSFTFNTLIDAAPSVTTTTPANGDTNVATGSNIVINFSEPVDVVDTPSAAFGLTCGGVPVAFSVTPALPATNQTSFTLDPAANLPATSTCEVTVSAANVRDTDLDDLPDNMAANYSFTFNTLVDAAPTVNQSAIVPASTSTGPNAASLNNPVSTTPTLSIPFSEAINAAAGAFTLTCNATPLGVSTSSGTNVTGVNVSPLAALSAGANCVLTVVAPNISDVDNDDPPNLMAVNFSLSFTVDTAPSETLTRTEVGNTLQDVTGAGATNVDLDSDIQVTFNEAVNVSFPANGLQCPAGVNIPVTVTTNNAATIVLNPDVNLPLNTNCVLNIPASNIADVDTADAPDNPVAAVNHTFQTVDDDAPTVTTNPANAAGNVAVNSNITVTFNEPVGLTGGWFTLSCTVSGTRTSTGELTGTGLTIIENTPDLVYTIDPTADFGVGDICTVTIDSVNVVDLDPIDGPNELDGNGDLDVVNGDADDYVAVFSTADTAPQVSSTTPTTGAIVGAGQAITLNFSEAVNIAAGAFAIECPSGTPITGGFSPSVALPTVSAVTSITLTPNNPLPFAAGTTSACRVTAESTLITDADGVNPPSELDGDASNDITDGDADDFVLNFNVDAQATETLTEVETGGVFGNIAGATNIDLDTNIRVTFSEPVTAGTSAFDLECPAGNDVTFTVTGSGTNVITIDPTPATLPVNTLCDFDIIAANITDVDTNDAPDTLDTNVNYTFTTVNDDAPTITNTAVEVGNTFTVLPLGAGVFADVDTNLRVTFSEAVTTTGNWASLTCSVSGIQSVGGATLAVTDADPVFTLNPNTNLTPGENCTLTVFASQINDDDTLDPPANLPADGVFTFTVRDVPPQVNAGTTIPANGATVPNNQAVTINFTEVVDIAAGGITWQCGASNISFTPTLPQNNVSSVTLTPSTALPAGSCTVTLESTLITDDDTTDPPNQLDGNADNDTIDGDADDFIRTFTVDTPPQVSTVTVEVVGVPTFLPLSGVQADVETNIVVTFTENIDATTTGLTLTCDGNPVAFTGLPVTNVSSVTLNPTTDLPSDVDCTVLVVSTDVTDTDTFDPPNQLDGNYDQIEGPSIGFLFRTELIAIANDDSYTVTPHLTYTSPTGVRANDTPATLTITGFGDTLATANAQAPNGTNFITADGAGGRVIMNADGTFRFYPDAGDDNTDGVATFFYTVAGGDTAQVTLTFEAEQHIWFVDGSVGACTVSTGSNLGTQACPATDIPTVAAVDTANDIIFVADGNYACPNIALENNEWVIGDGSSSTLAALVASRVSPVAGSDFAPYNTFSGTAPRLNSTGNCFIFSQNNEVRGVQIANTTGYAFIDGGGNIGTSAINQVSISQTPTARSGGIFSFTNGGTLNATIGNMESTTSAASPIVFTNMAGTITQTGTGTVTSNGAFDLFDINGGSIGGSFSSAFSRTSGAGSMIDVSGGHTGTFTFSGAISSTSATGDNFQFDNADGSYTFSGDVDLLTGTAGVNVQNGSGGTLSFTSAGSDIERIQGIPFRINNSTMNVNYDGDITHRRDASGGALLSARVIEIIGGTGVISFDGVTAVGTVPFRAAAESVFLQDTGNTNTITFNYVDSTHIDTPAFVSSVSGRVLMNQLRVNCEGNLGVDNHCIDIADTMSMGFTVEALRTDHDDGGESGGALSLVNTPGIWTVENTIDVGFGATGRDAVMFYGNNFGTLNISTIDSPTSPGGVAPFFVTANDRAAFDLTNGNANIHVTTLESFSTNDHGINLVNVTGPLFRASGNVVISGAAGSNELINIGADSAANAFSSAQSATIARVQIGTDGTTNNNVTLNQRRATGVRLGNFNGTITNFGNLIVTAFPAATGNGVEYLTSDGNLTFRTVDIDLSAATSTAEAQTTPEYPNVNDISGGNGILIEGSNGRLTIANSGVIDNTIGIDGQAIDARRSGGVTLNNLTLNQVGGEGIQFSDMTGNSFLNNVHITNYGIAGSSRAIIIRNQANAGGDFTFTDLDIQQSNVVITPQALLDFGALNSASGNINIQLAESAAGLCNLVGRADNTAGSFSGHPALQIAPNGTQVVDVQVDNCTFNSLSELRFTPASNAIMTGILQNNLLTNFEHESSVADAAMVTFAPQDNATMEMTFRNNQMGLESITGTQVGGIRVRPSGSASANIHIDSNPVMGPFGNNAIYFDADDTSVNNNLLITDNLIGTTAATEIRDGGILIVADVAGNVLNLSATGNIIGRAGAGADDEGLLMRVGNAAGVVNFNGTVLNNSFFVTNDDAIEASTVGAPNICLDIRSNVLNTVGGGFFGINLVESGGNMLVEGAGTAVVTPANLVAAQAGGAANTASVTGTPTYNGGVNCQEPPPAGASYSFNSFAPSTLVQAPTFGVPSEIVVAPSLPETLLGGILNLGADRVYAQVPLGINIPLGNIPANTQVTATFDVLVGDVPLEINRISLQGTLSANNIVGVLSNDPDTSIASDATITLLDPLRVVQELPATGETPIWRNRLIAALAAIGGTLLAAMAGLWWRRRQVF